jgi:serine/threonine protein kinase
VGKNKDDQSTGAESFDFAPRDAKNIGGSPDSRFDKTSVDHMKVHKGNSANTSPGLANSSNLAGADMALPPDPYDENLAGLHIAQNYEILEKVGEGGMSAVYRARHMHLNREVAVKMLHPHLVSNRISRERFSQEARAVSQIEHQNVVRLLDFGITEENRPYIVMDFLRGSSLSEVIKQTGPLDNATAISVFLQICDALAYTHDKGIVHRDLKPSNVILLDKRNRSTNADSSVPQTVAKIVDFGIAKLQPHEDGGMAALTQTGDVFGSPLYMSPEQAKGERLDNRADIYSMGCLMYESLTGVPPINGTNMLEILYRHMNEMPKPMNMVTLNQRVPIPRNLEAIIFKALAKDPKDRYQDMRSLAADLEKYASSGPGFAGTIASIWSLYRSRRQRLNVREKIAMVATTIALISLLVCSTSFGYFYFKGTQDFSQDRELTWKVPSHKAKAETYYDPTSHLVSISLRGSELRIKELRDQSMKGQPIEATESDYDAVQTLLHNASELKSRGNLDAATAMLNKAIELGTIVHGPESQVIRQAMIVKLTTIYQNGKWADCIALIEQMQRDIPEHTLYQRTYYKALFFSILGVCNFHLKNYEKARADLLEALNNWDEADEENEHYETNVLEIRALASSYFADCFYQDSMWEESIKYYKKAFDAWGLYVPPLSDYNRALALFKQSLAYSHLHDDKLAEPLLKQALEIVRRYPKDFDFCQAEVAMTQLSAKLDQERGNWLAGMDKFIHAGLAKNRPRDNDNKVKDKGN